MSLLGDEGEEQEGPRAPLLPPDDRLWRHPSEVQSTGRPGPDRSRPPTRSRRRSRPDAGPGTRRSHRARPGLSVLTGVLLGSGLTAAGMLLTGVAGGGSTGVLTDRAGSAGPVQRGTGGGTRPGRDGGEIEAGQAGQATTVTAAFFSRPTGSEDQAPVHGAESSPAGTGSGIASVSHGLTAGADRAWPSVVKVEAEKGGLELAGYGTETATTGIVLTTDHLVDGVDEVTVTDSMGNRLMATVVGADPVTDVGVLRVQPTDWFPLEASSSAPRSDQVVSAVTGKGDIYLGELTSTYTNTDVPGRQPMLGALASDLQLPPASEGAPLVDQHGRMVGMVGATGNPAGSTLAVPSAMADGAAHSLVSTGSVPHGWIGVDQVTPGQGGVIVDQVESGSPAAAAGIRAGDVITAVSGQQISSVDDLWAAVRLRQPGSRVTVAVMRPSGTQSLSITLGSLSGH